MNKRLALLSTFLGVALSVSAQQKKPVSTAPVDAVTAVQKAFPQFANIAPTVDTGKGRITARMTTGTDTAYLEGTNKDKNFKLEAADVQRVFVKTKDAKGETVTWLISKDADSTYNYGYNSNAKYQFPQQKKAVTQKTAPKTKPEAQSSKNHLLGMAKSFPLALEVIRPKKGTAKQTAPELTSR